MKIKLSFMALLLTLFSFKGISQDSYCILKKKLDAGHYQMILNGKLIFKFNEEYTKQGTALNYKIYTDNRTLVPTCNPVLNGKMGDNRYQLFLTSCGLTNNAIYILEVYNEKNEKWLARFKYMNYIP